MSKEEKLDWIYKGANSLIDREEYLLGRKVDKPLEQINEEEKEKKFVLPTPKNHVEHECIPPSIRDFNKIVLAEQVDLSAKLQEDPLVAIKKREEEVRRQFLQNPVQLKKLQEALKQQQEQKKKHKKSKRKYSDDDLDEKLKEKLKLLKNSSLGIGIPKKNTKKDSDDALNTILMHKFNALKDKLSEDDLQDILNGSVSDDSDEDKPKKKKRKKKKKQESSDSDNERKKSKSRKNKGAKESDSSDNKEKIKKRDRSSSMDSDEKMKKSINRRKRNYSSEKETKRSKSPKRKRESNKSYSRERSLEYKYKNEGGSLSSRKEYDTKSKPKRSRSRQSRSKDRYLPGESSKSSNNSRERIRSTSCERIERNKKDNRKQATSKTNSNERQDSTKLTKQNYRRERDNSSESDGNNYRGGKGKNKIKEKEKSDSDLDEKIMAKLRLLRGEVETNIQKSKNLNEKQHLIKEGNSTSSSDDDDHRNKKVILPAKPPHLKVQNQNSISPSKVTNTHKNLKTLLPEKPSHLRRQSGSSDSSGSEKFIYKGNYGDSEEEKLPKSFGLVTSDGKKLALKKGTEYKKVDAKNKKIEPIAKPERKNIKKLTEEEKEALRKEMMRNADVRDKEREINVKRYKEKDKREEEMTTKNFDADLVHTELLKSAKLSSVEQRIKSNLNNIQRSSRHMNSNFSKR